ncbi:MAG TPA: DUF5703 domain-containing protein, partial [Mucilaginibacter sp.]|nr:DUF5703 domain-containing protein [Mucilaginibacter sp.]
MKKLINYVGCCAAVLLSFVQLSFGQGKSAQTTNSFITQQTVSWTSPGKDENDSMPIGNGKFGANVWTEQNGDLLLLLSSPDTWIEKGDIVKLARVRIKLMPNPFTNATDFTQSLKVESGTIEIKTGANLLKVWVDANHPVLHVDGSFEKPVSAQASLEDWRKIKPVDEYKPGDYTQVMSGDASPKTEPDILFPADKAQITWCHYNASSYFPFILKQEHLESLLSTTKDPLLHRCFGAVISGATLLKKDDYTLVSKTAVRTVHLQVVANIGGRYDSPVQWKSETDLKVFGLSKLDLDAS